MRIRVMLLSIECRSCIHNLAHAILGLKGTKKAHVNEMKEFIVIDCEDDLSPKTIQDFVNKLGYATKYVGP